MVYKFAYIPGRTIDNPEAAIPPPSTATKHVSGTTRTVATWEWIAMFVHFEQPLTAEWARTAEPMPADLRLLDRAGREVRGKYHVSAKAVYGAGWTNKP